LVGEWFSENLDPDKISEDAIYEQGFFESTLNPEQIFVYEEDINILITSIDKLPPLQRSILILFHQDELSINEIGKIVEMPVNTVKSHLFRARKVLKELLTHN
jgi:RNA polymerase sigma factor (sigma-70 family)